MKPQYIPFTDPRNDEEHPVWRALQSVSKGKLEKKKSEPWSHPNFGNLITQLHPDLL